MKIGIITHYYNNHNYGGLLQAYALCHFLNSKGYAAEQICYVTNDQNDSQSDFNGQYKRTRNKVQRITLKNMLRLAKNITLKIFSSIKNRKWKKRYFLMESFQKSIPHSEQVYSKKTISSISNKYDCFITGSDQVWNTDWFVSTYFLDFVGDNEKKISYAASIGKPKLNQEQNNIFKQYLSDYKAISVREKQACSLLEDATGRQDVKWVLDPTLLLEKDDWDLIASKRIIKEKYVFCFFLGEDTISRNKAMQYAKEKKLKIVNVPHLYNYKKTESDYHFGDYKLFYISPNDFISLIKYAECVFTNSYHASVFSCIYSKNFFVFNRLDEMKMSDRIDTLCELFGCMNHYCNDEKKNTIEYILKVSDIDYRSNSETFISMKQASKDFLLNSIGS